MELTADLLKALTTPDKMPPYMFTRTTILMMKNALWHHAHPCLTEVNRAAVRKNYQSASEWFRLYQA